MTLSIKKRKPLATIVAWCFYDWACASYSIIIITFIFSPYFTTKIAENEIIGTYQWGLAMAIAGLFIAISSPLFGAIADYGGNHKVWLIFFSWLCIIPTALLWFAYPNSHFVYYALFLVVISSIGYEVAQVFYNAFLLDLAPKDYLGRISGWGWGSGYVGGILALTFTLIFFIQGHYIALPTENLAQIRICGPFAALWFALFSLPFFIKAPMLSSHFKPLPQAIRTGVYELFVTMKKLRHDRNVLLYLLSHMVYTDGLNTLFAFGGIYAAGTYGLTFEEVLLFGITMNIAAGIGAFIFGWVDDFLGPKMTILGALFFLLIFGIVILILQDKYSFWVTALLLSLFVGPVQSASRSLMVHLITTKKNSAEMFGLYALSGKITAFMGPWLLGTTTYFMHSQRMGMATLLIFFIIGALLLLPVQVQNTFNLKETSAK